MFVNCSDIKFGYSSDKTVLQGIDFSLQKGKTLAIVGVSGCGKSTLLRILSSILPNTKNNSFQGKISIDNLSPDEYRKTGKMAFMFQDSTLLPHLTVQENIALPLLIRNDNNPDRVKQLLEMVGLTEFANYLPKQLSGGMKTRVSLARSFVTEPELLLLDEPFSALDISWKSNLYIELENLREQNNTTVIMVTHDVQEALLLSDQVIVLNKIGTVEALYNIKTNFTLLQRVSNISEYISSVYAQYMMPIQNAIINGKKTEVDNKIFWNKFQKSLENVFKNQRQDEVINNEKGKVDSKIFWERFRENLEKLFKNQ